MTGPGAALLLCLVAAPLAGCSEGSGVGTPTDLETPAVPQDPAPPDTVAPIELLALTDAQLENIDLHGELACAFADPELGTLLVARADVQPDGPVHGVLSNNGYTEMLSNLEAGGFDDLADGIVLTGKGLTAVLRRGARHPTGDESTRHAATLTIQRAGGAERSYQGTLSCGP